MTNFATVHSQLYTILNTAKATIGADAIYKYMPNSLNGTPAIAIQHIPSGEEMITTEDNELSTNFTIRAIAEHTNDLSTQYPLLLGVVDKILVELRKDDNETLGGNCHYFLAEEIGGLEYGELASLKVIYIDINISAKMLKSKTA